MQASVIVYAITSYTSGYVFENTSVFCYYYSNIFSEKIKSFLKKILFFVRKFKYVRILNSKSTEKASFQAVNDLVKSFNFITNMQYFIGCVHSIKTVCRIFVYSI